jgi:hypothetical protein
MPTKRLVLDEQRSGIQLRSDCRRCGQKNYTFRRDGLVISVEQWLGEKMFLIEQFGKSGATFLTDAGLALLSSKGFTNLCPRPAGIIEEWQ